MANGDDISGAAPDVQTGPPQGGAPGPGPPGGPSPMGQAPGGVLAALAKRGQGPQPSAPGMGNMAHGLMQLKTACDMLQSALPSLPSESKQYRDVLKALSSLTRHLPQGAPTAGVQQTQLGDLLRSTMRNALMQKIIGQQGQGGPGGGAGGGGGMGGGMPQAPTPSTPLPGA